MDHVELGRLLRSRRAALSRTVATVAADAGLSMPYVANLENGRGNPTISALDRLAAALGTQLTVTFSGPDTVRPEVIPPASLTRFAQTHYFRREVSRLEALGGNELRDIRTRLLDALAAVGHTLGRDLHERDWQRLLDAVILVLAHPAG